MVDMKALTGESEPGEVKIGQKVYSGSINLSGLLEARVSKVYAESTASRIMGLVEGANKKKSETEKFADRFTKYYTPIVTCLGILVIEPAADDAAGARYGDVDVPGTDFPRCRLSVRATRVGSACISRGIGAASKQGVLMKGSNFLEALSKAETFIFDKTGTLTQGVFHVKKICPKGMTAEELLELTAHGEAYSSHPIAVSLQEAYGKDVNLGRVKYIKEFSGFGVMAEIDGKDVYIGNSKFMNRQGLYYQPVSEDRDCGPCGGGRGICRIHPDLGCAAERRETYDPMAGETSA